MHVLLIVSGHFAKKQADEKSGVAFLVFVALKVILGQTTSICFRKDCMIGITRCLDRIADQRGRNRNRFCRRGGIEVLIRDSKNDVIKNGIDRDKRKVTGALQRIEYNRIIEPLRCCRIPAGGASRISRTVRRRVEELCLTPIRRGELRRSSCGVNRLRSREIVFSWPGLLTLQKLLHASLKLLHASLRLGLALTNFRQALLNFPKFGRLCVRPTSKLEYTFVSFGFVAGTRKGVKMLLRRRRITHCWLVQKEKGKRKEKILQHTVTCAQYDLSQ